MGPFGSKITKENYVTAGVPVVRGVNLARGIFVDDEFVFITEEKADEIMSANVEPGDLIFTHRGTIGQVSMIPRAPRFNRYVIGSSQVKTRLDATIAQPEFYYYWFQSSEGQRSILANASTVGVPGIATPLTSIRKLQVPLPPLQEQQAIVAVLGALDDKIAANNRVARSTDRLVKLLHEKETAAQMGRRSRLAEFATVVVGGTPSRSKREYWDAGSIAWINSGKANDFRVVEPSERITDLALQKSSVKIMPPRATIIGITGATMGRVSRIEIAAGGSQNVAGVWVNEPKLNDWIFCEISRNVSELTKHATGGAQQHINKQIVNNLEVVVPSGECLDLWGAEAGPLLERTAQSLRECLSLATLRDTLLPQLMSGKLRVRDAEKIVEDAV
jgi:type I restriction enzyme S subunit